MGNETSYGEDIAANAGSLGISGEMLDLVRGKRSNADFYQEKKDENNFSFPKRPKQRIIETRLLEKTHQNSESGIDTYPYSGQTTVLDNLHKKIIENPFSSSQSSKLTKNFTFDFNLRKQEISQVFQNAGVNEQIVFGFTGYGSAFRGHAHENSDLDVDILVWINEDNDSENNFDFHKVAREVSEVLSSANEDRREISVRNIFEVAKSLAKGILNEHSIAILFGPNSLDRTGLKPTIQGWRKTILQQMSRLPANQQIEYWDKVQAQWRKLFVHHYKQLSQPEEVIRAKLEEVGINGEKLDRALRLVKAYQNETQLPDITEMYSAYGISS